jgi:hypothetical protein
MNPFGQGNGQSNQNHHRLPPGATYSRPTLLGREESWATASSTTSSPHSSSLQQAVQNRKRRYSLLNSSPTAQAASGSTHYPPRFPPVRLSHRPRRTTMEGQEVIDLTGEDTPPRPRPPPRQSSTSTTQQQQQQPQQPRWQPDAEAISCYVCDNRFTFLNRRHHCRYLLPYAYLSVCPHKLILPLGNVVV